MLALGARLPMLSDICVGPMPVRFWFAGVGGNARFVSAGLINAPVLASNCATQPFRFVADDDGPRFATSMRPSAVNTASDGKPLGRLPAAVNWPSNVPLAL